MRSPVRIWVAAPKKSHSNGMALLLFLYQKTGDLIRKYNREVARAPAKLVLRENGHPVRIWVAAPRRSEHRLSLLWFKESEQTNRAASPFQITIAALDCDLGPAMSFQWNGSSLYNNCCAGHAVMPGVSSFLHGQDVSCSPLKTKYFQGFFLFWWRKKQRHLD